jgi:signal transduction histidine kinase
MEFVRAILQWLSGGEMQYHTLSHCMMGDTFWISLTVTLDLLVAAGYILIAYHWNRNEKSLPPSPARTALRMMRNIFVFCGLCGYVFIPIKMFWPAWRLYDMFMVGLVFYTWRYAINAKNLRVIYTAIGRSNQLADDLQKSQEESKRKTFFLNAISHDLRTPLNGMMLQANLAEIHAAANDNEAVQQSIEEIKSSVRLTAELLDGLLEFARLEAAEDRITATEFDLGVLLRDLLNTHAAAAAKKSLELTGPAFTTNLICTDRLRLERILNNLITNAIKFTEKGSVRIEVESTPRQVKICVADTGIGISPEHQKRLFEEFFQVQNHERDRHKGFGLGLAICQRLVHQLGGSIQVSSEQGVGSRFSVVLRRVVPSIRSQMDAQPAVVQPATVTQHPTGAAGGR